MHKFISLLAVQETHPIAFAEIVQSVLMGDLYLYNVSLIVE
ncbi:hypothetical protein [Bacillus altitudinis]|nr:hypothetical protein [Bacillus altitudinis]